MTEGWSDQRVNQLKKLWQQGKSASEIAETLGGVTRNAVIGKAHRLGLSGRPSPIKKPAAPAKKTTSKAASPTKAPARSVAKTSTAKPAATKAVPKPTAKATPAKPAAKPVPTPTAPKKSVPTHATKGTPFNPPLTQEVMARPLMVHDGEVISILDLTERTCRWPIGDPKDPAFGYCGAQSHPGFPYCAGHVAMAFQSSRKDNRKTAIVKDDEVEDIEDVEIEDVDGDEDIVDDTLEDETDDEMDLEV